MELKWILAIGFEAAFWLMLATFLVLRYRYAMEGITRAFVIGAVLDTAGIVALGRVGLPRYRDGQRVHALRRGNRHLRPHGR
jgi:hypothetical protein